MAIDWDKLKVVTKNTSAWEQFEMYNKMDSMTVAEYRQRLMGNWDNSSSKKEEQAGDKVYGFLHDSRTKSPLCDLAMHLHQRVRQSHTGEHRLYRWTEPDEPMAKTNVGVIRGKTRIGPTYRGEEGELRFEIHGGFDRIVMDHESNLLSQALSFHYFDKFRDMFGEDMVQLVVKFDVVEHRSQKWSTYDPFDFKVRSICAFNGRYAVEEVFYRSGEIHPEHSFVVERVNDLSRYGASISVVSKHTSKKEAVILCTHQRLGVELEVMRHKELGGVIMGEDPTPDERLVLEMVGLDSQIWIDNPEVSRMMKYTPKVNKAEIIDLWETRPQFKI